MNNFCITCNNIKELDYDLGRPIWPNEPGTAPNHIIRVPCPDCVPCAQCANPNHDGIHTCRNFSAGADGHWVEGLLYSTGPKEYIGAMPIRTELAILPEQSPKPKSWIVKEIISINGNKYLKLLSKYLKKVNKTSEDELTEQEIDKLYHKARYK